MEGLEGERMNAYILGNKSDIAKAITPMLEADGWTVNGWSRGKWPSHPEKWDLLIICIGVVAPVGLWHSTNWIQWSECLYSNLTLPFELLKRVWGAHKPDSTVIWFAGSNPNKIMDGYSAYNTAKMAVIKLVEQLNHETQDCKFVAFGPGYVKTKIHKATLDAGWPNERIARGDGNSMEDVYAAMKWCIEQPKEVVGGRNICVSDKISPEFLEKDPNMFKLRRLELGFSGLG